MFSYSLIIIDMCVCVCDMLSSFIDAHMYMYLGVTIWDWVINKETLPWERMESSSLRGRKI